MRGEKHIRISHVYSVDHPTPMTQLMTPADFAKPIIPACDNWLDVLPADLTSYIIKLTSVPSTEALADLVYKEFMQLRPDDITKHGEIYTYDWTFSNEETEEDRAVKDYVLEFDDRDDDSVIFSYNLAVNAINKILSSWAPDYYDDVFNYYFKDIAHAKKYIKKNKYAIGAYYFVEDEEDHTFCVKTRAMSYFLITCFHENYKLMIDQGERFPNGDDGDYLLRVAFFKRGDGETIYDGTEKARILEEMSKNW